MKSRLLVNLALLALVVVVGLAAYFWPEKPAEPAVRLSELHRDDVTRVRVERRGSPAMELEKLAEGDWRMRAPFSTRADRYQMDRLIDLVSATAKQTLPRARLERYDLDPPSVRVTLNDELFEFGATNELTNEQYVAKDDSIYLIPTFYGYNLPMDATKLISHRLLADSEIPVAFDFGAWKVSRDERGDWQISGRAPAKDTEISQDDLQQWLAEWRRAGSLTAEPYRGPRARERIAVTLGDGRVVVFDILSRRQDVRMVRTDENILYQFTDDGGGRLLDPYRVARRD
jgi:hypothetical protein